MLKSELLVRVTRGPLTECFHRGHIIVINASGQILYELGNPQHVTFARSTAKLLQVVPLIELGAADYYGFTSAEIAVMCASHNGEREHVQTVKSILTKLGIDESALLCGSHKPYDRKTREQLEANGEKPSSLHNNCSGKHAGMLALAKYLNMPLIAYIERDHPIQKHITETIAELAQIEVDDMAIGVDGCGVPVFGLSIEQLALAYSRYGNGQYVSDQRAHACRRIVAALREEPFYFAGSERFDTRLIEVTNGRIIGKMGAEGVYAVTVPSSSIGIAIKVEDGAARALYPTVVETLKQLLLLNESELAQLATFHQPAILNRSGMHVGTIEPSFKLNKVN